MKTSVIYDSHSVDLRLAELGVEAAPLRQACAKGLLAWANCTENHPRMIPGSYQWGETVAALRENLLRSGWRRYNDSGSELTINASGNVAIAVSSGDPSTGISDESPLTSNPKGAKTEEMIFCNVRQLSYLASGDIATLRGGHSTDRATWLLLYYRDLNKRELRMELSNPISIGVDGRVDGWHERLILEPIDLDDADQLEIEQEEDAFGTDFEITRRA